MALTVAVDLSAIRLGQDEASLIDYHLTRLGQYRSANLLREAYYEGKARVKSLDISLPPALKDRIQMAVGWPGTAVDVLEERLDWLGWTSATGVDAFGLDEIRDANALDVDMSLGILDALIYGTSFVAVGSGELGEPNPLVTVESPMNTTGEYDGRLRRLSSALTVDKMVNGQAVEVTLYLPEEDLRCSHVSGQWRTIDRNPHNRGRVGIVQLINRPRASRLGGRSEISRAVMSYTDAAVRTLLGMEVNREFYSAPQRYVMGAEGSMFTDGDGNLRTGWEAVMGRLLALPKDEDGERPEVGQFTPSSPAPYLEQVRGLSQLLAAEAAIPAPYLGFVTENPSSADAIRQAEARLIKRAERRQTVFGRALLEVAALCLLTRDGTLPDDFRSVGVDWKDAATPTRSAAADEAVKLIGAGVLPADSKVTYDRIGLSPQEQKQVTSDKRRANASQTLNVLAAAAQAARQDPAVAGADARTSEVPNGLGG